MKLVAQAETADRSRGRTWPSTCRLLLGAHQNTVHWTEKLQ